MARWLVWMRCIGQAVVNKGLKALVGLVPFGESFYEVAADAMDRVKKEQQREDERRAALQDLVQAPAQEIQRQAEAVAREVAADQPVAVQQQLATYLMQVPAVVRASLRRPEDPTGTTVPATRGLSRPEDLLPLLPSRPPRFKAGDRPAGVGDWVLERLLGMGGFGEVWLARNPHLPDPVALKFCLDASAARVLRNEAKLLGRVISQGRHPGIVALKHTYLNADPPCLEYEFVAGGDLAGLIHNWHRRPGPELIDRTTRLMRQLADVVAFAHRLSPPIVHRDLKPANILLQPKPNGTHVLRVADFGIGGVAAQQALVQTHTGSTQAAFLGASLLGSHTPLYASPQQMLGAAPDPRDDVHALGVIWLQLLTGDLTRGAVADWREELAEQQVPDAVVQVLGKCVASRAEKRLASAAALVEELDRLTATPPMAVPVAPLPAARPSSVPVPPHSVSQDDLASQVQRTLQGVQQAHDRARRFQGQGDYAAAVRELETVAEHLRDADLYPTLCRQRDRTTQLTQEVRAAVQAMRFEGLRGKVQELLQLQPQRSDLKTLLNTLPWEPDKALTNSIGLKMVLVPAGRFVMGSPDAEAERSGDESPQRQVSIGRPFYLGVYPVTQREYEAVMRKNPAHFHSSNGGSPDHPVEQVSWEEAVEFCKRLSGLPQEKAAGRVYRLPTEAEWEYACRAGTTTPFWWGDSASATQANFDGRNPYGGAGKGQYLEHTTKVGSYQANPWGLYDVHGNVWEWCSDWYDENYYRVGDNSDPQGPKSGSGRVLRGGSWDDYGRDCRAAYRNRRGPGFRYDGFGFRVALTLPPRTP